jgi:hypothetical protein
MPTSENYDTSDPRYGSVEDTPVDPLPGYTDKDEILDALNGVEERIELDLNRGKQITDPGSHIHKAANTLATYHLTRTMVAPNAQRGGDLGDDGGRRGMFAEQYLDEYNHMVDMIVRSGSDSDGGAPGHRRAFFTHRDGDGHSDPRGTD